VTDDGKDRQMTDDGADDDTTGADGCY